MLNRFIFLSDWPVACTPYLIIGRYDSCMLAPMGFILQTTNSQLNHCTALMCHTATVNITRSTRLHVTIHVLKKHPVVLFIPILLFAIFL